MNVLSLFDGMSVGMQALKELGIKIDNYYASEIDKYAIQISKKNHPEIIHLGDVTKWREWELPKIDLIIGGSPCQGFSFAGKQLNFDDPRSKLFFVMDEIIKELKPKYFMLENVKMKKENEQIITEYMGVSPILINSALVSAQNRNRLYWTNIKNIVQPEDRKIFIKDITEDESCLVGAFRGRYKINGIRQDHKIKTAGLTTQELEIRYNMKSNCLTTVSKDNVCILVGMNEINGFDIIKRVYSTQGKSPTPTTMQGGNREPKIAINEIKWRKLTALECERLQTLPDGYTEGVSNSQRYKMLGNGWTLEVIKHIFKGLL